MQLKFTWDAKHNLIIRKIYDHQAAKQLRQMMSDVRKGSDHLSSWIRPALKKKLEAYFNNDERFKRRHLTNVANRTSPRSSKYTGGSATFMKTKCILFKSSDHEATLAETFKYTHTLKAKKERFADEQSIPPNGNNKASSETQVVDPDRFWRETASESHKNRRFRLGSFFASGLRSSTLAFSFASASATNSADPQKVVDLREEVQKLIQKLHQQAEQSEQRYNDLLAHVGGTVAISSDLTEKMEQLNLLREQMEVYNHQMRTEASGARASGTAGSSDNATGGTPPTPIPSPAVNSSFVGQLIAITSHRNYGHQRRHIYIV
ncbi:hypothetical protein Ahy_A03g012425 [Arachis hypogaea]|uniref:Uncharacterized protein n=1 Tax=Arachis hypogaea TaxID=3818 RepID=A0A445DTD3_ARAHY|nr:hypothetical protein Ahy_A03g012425 [Arachis hypogaea]